MSPASLAVAVLVYITPYGIFMDQKVSEPMPAATCEKAVTHPAVREAYDNMLDLNGRRMALICIPIIGNSQ